jgi:hypothetical protein
LEKHTASGFRVDEQYDGDANQTRQFHPAFLYQPEHSRELFALLAACFMCLVWFTLSPCDMSLDIQRTTQCYIPDILEYTVFHA